jgi:hypothetical protein
MIVPEQLDYYRKNVIKKYVDEVMWKLKHEQKEKEKENVEKVN